MSTPTKVAANAVASDWFAKILTQSQEKNALCDQFSEYRHAAVQEAKSILASGQLPHRKQEIWRYTSLTHLQEKAFNLAAGEPTHHSHIVLQDEWFSSSESYKVVLLDGVFSPQLSQLDRLPEGCFIGPINRVDEDFNNILEKYLGQAIEQKMDQKNSIFSQLNGSDLSSGVLLYISARVHLEQPIEILYLSGREDSLQLLQPRNLIVLDEQAKAQVSERYVSLNQVMHFNNYVTEIILETQAVLNHVQIQQQNLYSYYLNHVALKQLADSDYCGTYLALGAAMARTELGVYFNQSQAKCRLNGLCLVSAKQLIDYHLDIRHAVAACASETNFRGILLAPGRAVFDGNIVLEKGAQKSQAHLTAHNLLLSRQAEVDSKPQLVIHADDVQCSHGSSVGQLDEDAVFYLRSRGFSEFKARQTLAMGFAEDVLKDIEADSLRHALDKLMARAILAGVQAQ